MNPHDSPKWDMWAAQGLTEDEMRAEMQASHENESYNPQEYFFNTIIRKAHERPVTAADFEEFVGCQNWLLMDREDMSFDWRARNDDKQIVTGFRLRRVFDNGKVEIVADIGEHLHGGTVMHIDADELAIRMDAS